MNPKDRIYALSIQLADACDALPEGDQETAHIRATAELLRQQVGRWWSD